MARPPFFKAGDWLVTYFSYQGLEYDNDTIPLIADRRPLFSAELS